MQLSPLYMSNFRGAFPEPALNLSASAWTLEDTLIFTDILLHNPVMPQTMIISLDPWDLRWNVGDRYSILGDHLVSILHTLGINKTGEKREPYLIKLLVNSISFEYFVQSLKHFFDPTFKLIPDNALKDYGEVNPADFQNGFNFDLGYDYRITLKDGSRVLNQQSIWDMKNDYVQGNVGFVGQEGEYWDPNAIDVFKKVISLVREKGTAIYFVLLPFSPLVFEEQHAADRERIIAVEKKIREFAAANNIKILGSYDPQTSHLGINDFLDCQHPKPSALARFDFSH